MSKTNKPKNVPKKSPKRGLATGIVGLSLLAVPLILLPFSIIYRHRELDWYDLVIFFFSLSGFILITIAITLAANNQKSKQIPQETSIPLNPIATTQPTEKSALQILEDQLISGQISALEYTKLRADLKS